MDTTVLSPADFASVLERYHHEAGNDAQLVVRGLKDEAEHAQIYASYDRYFTHDQLDALRAARDAEDEPRAREELNRLWFAAAGAVAVREVVQEGQDLENEQLAWRTSWDGEDVSLATIGALMASEPDYDRRDALYELMCEADEQFAQRELDLAVRSQTLRSEVFGLDGEIGIAEARMGIDVRAFSRDVQAVSDATADFYAAETRQRFPVLLDRDVEFPSRAHAASMRSLHAYDGIFTRERMLDACNATLAQLGFDIATIPTIRPDVEDRPNKDPRACVIDVSVPDEVYLVVRPTGGLTDYQAYLHEAGHALHFGLTSKALPFSFRGLSPDNALTEIYSYVVERITHEPAWHVRHFGVTDAQAEEICAATRFIDAMLFRRYGAKLAYELEFWSEPQSPRNPDRYALLLSNATRMKYPTSQYVSDMDAGLYAADYLRAWRTSEEVIAYLHGEFGNEWFADARAGEFLRELFVQGTEPTNEQVLAQIGKRPADFGALTHALSH